MCTPHRCRPRLCPLLHLQRVAPEAVRSLRQVVRDIAAQEGVAGLFKGALPSVLKAAPSAAVTFAVYDSCMYWLTLRQRQEAAAGGAPGSAPPPRRPLH